MNKQTNRKLEMNLMTKGDSNLKNVFSLCHSTVDTYCYIEYLMCCDIEQGFMVSL